MFGRKLRRIDSIEEQIPASEHDHDAISLEELGNAYFSALSQAESSKRSPESSEGELHASQSSSNDMLLRGTPIVDTEKPLDAPSVSEADGTPITMENVLEAILFLGEASGDVIDADRLAHAFRETAETDIERGVEWLNRRYARDHRAFWIKREKGGYKLELLPSMHYAHDVFYGKIKEVQLQQNAIDCLALVAYNPGLSRSQLDDLWGHPTSNILAMLIRKELIRCERSESGNEMVFYTTERFLDIVGLNSLEDLPIEE